MNKQGNVVKVHSKSRSSLFIARIPFTVKKEGWQSKGVREIHFMRGQGDIPELKPSSKALSVSIGPGLPKNTSKR